MSTSTIETDYLVIGSGAAGMAFVDSLIDERDVDVVVVDRHHAPGGHWVEAYPFVRLHQPSRYYGVNSMPLGNDAIAPHGTEAGMYERASAAEICAYYERVMYERLIPSGRARFFPKHEFVGDDRIVSLLSGNAIDIRVRKKRVDARYLEAAIPATTAPRFDIAAEVSCVPVNQLSRLAGPPEGYVIIGSGKTGIDACLWLLESGVAPERIKWIKPREAWLYNRRHFQPGELVTQFFQGIALQMEAAASATSADDLFDRLEASDVLRRVDRSVRPTMHKGATISDRELGLLRRIQNVTRLGHVRRIEPTRIVMDEGTLPTSTQHVHVDCTAAGLRLREPVPIFGPSWITLQSIRQGLMPFNSALIAFIEAHRDEDSEKNRLCPPNPQTDTALDWARTTLIGMQADYGFSKEADIAAWLERARLNPVQGLPDRMADPEVQQSWKMFVEHVRPGLARLAELVERDG